MIVRKHLCLLLLVACLATLPWLGLTRFNTKGEPREAVVSLTMLQQGNWVLPTNDGGEIAYKPPFFHWTVAAASLLSGGVNEWTARLPSALAAICLTLWAYVFFARRRDSDTALLASLLFLSSFEVFRAAYACRVDMMLTLGVCGAIFSLAAWAEERGWWRFVLGVLMMSLGALTKGPVAILLPCLVTGVYMLLRGRGFLRTLLWLCLAAVLALVLPALWYAAAYRQGGEAFYSLVWEENVGRFLGKMTYRSHENGLWYYFALLPAGLLPWTLPALWQLWRKRRSIPSPRTWLRLSPETLLSLVALVLVFAFYCVPKSKRSVYLLPVYPFASWLVAVLLREWPRKVRRIMLGSVYSLWVVAFAVVLPLLLNRRSDKDIAEDIRRMRLEKPLVSYIKDSEAGDPMHFFTVNFYLGDIVGNWDNQPEGYLLVGERDAESFIAEHRQWSFKLQYTSPHRSCDTRQPLRLYMFYLR
ncbi:MAG: glycosyltransferase family 39 protein [Prevotellaceae bacterium]|nr:glycosyltransferase family 39 protein [Prevotellaceae bacterium]